MNYLVYGISLPNKINNEGGWGDLSPIEIRYLGVR